MSQSTDRMSLFQQARQTRNLNNLLKNSNKQKLVDRKSEQKVIEVQQKSRLSTASGDSSTLLDQLMYN